MKKLYKHFIVLTACWGLICPQVVYSQGKKQTFNLQELVLPSETKNIQQHSGNVYYSPTIKGKALMPINFWGEVGTPGLHFVPVDTTLLKGLSLAGGPRGDARLSNVKLTRSSNGEVSHKTFDLTKGGDASVYELQLRPGDIVFVERSYFYQDRAYYTSLLGVAATILTSIFLYQQIKKN